MNFIGLLLGSQCLSPHLLLVTLILAMFEVRASHPSTAVATARHSVVRRGFLRTDQRPSASVAVRTRLRNFRPSWRDWRTTSRPDEQAGDASIAPENRTPRPFRIFLRFRLIVIVSASSGGVVGEAVGLGDVEGEGDEVGHG